MSNYLAALVPKGCMAYGNIYSFMLFWHMSSDLSINGGTGDGRGPRAQTHYEKIGRGGSLNLSIYVNKKYSQNCFKLTGLNEILNFSQLYCHYHIYSFILLVLYYILFVPVSGQDNVLCVLHWFNKSNLI